MRRAKYAYKRIKNSFLSKAVILMYHRVIDLAVDPWSLCVSPDHFSQQMEAITRLGYPTRLSDLVEGLKSGKVHDRAVVVTFDDGYADNLYFAKPVLERYHVPGTVFVVAQSVGQEGEFWWDELEQLVLLPEHLAETLTLNINGKLLKWQIEPEILSPDANRLEYGSQNGSRKGRSAGSRLDFFYSVWKQLLTLSEETRKQTMEDIARWTGSAASPRPTHRIMNPEELIQLQQGGLVEVGGHTLTHVSLSSLPTAAQKAEILQGKMVLENFLGTPVKNFAYPFGEHSKETPSLVKEAGFQSACTIIPRSLYRNADPFLLPRFDVRDWDGDEFERYLTEWFRTGRI
jgi:peptidoglycan/xylan/chitin deacetylase (PgdA/CDA1 family)